jgi:hypothetical protein
MQVRVAQSTRVLVPNIGIEKIVKNQNLSRPYVMIIKLIKSI